jgi:hypothetical protein
MSKRLEILAKIEPDSATVRLIGRDAWALKCLISAGGRGCTPIDHPGPRWSAYVHKLRKAGFVIETIHENHAGAFAGTHARYVLRNKVTILDDSKVAA